MTPNPEATCKVCERDYIRFSTTQVVCGRIGCAKKYAERKRKQAFKDRKEAIKTRSQWLAEAKVAIQRFRRLEELSKGEGCISCERSRQEVESVDPLKPGGFWDGGHLFSKGSRPELALEPLNIWLQCKSCNAGSAKYGRKGYRVNLDFRANVEKRIGKEAVERLEADHGPRKYTIDELKSIKATYRAKAKELE